MELLDELKKTRDGLPKFLIAKGYTVGAEIGVYKAAFTNLLCELGLKIYAIDPWHSYASAGRAAKRQERQDFLYGHAQRVLTSYDNCTIIRKTSMDAVHQFKDNSLDFVYIDGDHSFKHVAQDIYEWSWKVKKGGIVAGHDYCYNGTHPQIAKAISHVGAVVDAYAKVFECKLIEFGYEDHARSWMWVRE